MNSARKAADRAWKENKQLRENLRRLQGGGDDDNYGDMSDLVSRVTRLEYGLIASFLTLIAAIGGLYLYIGAQMSNVDDRARSLTDRAASAEATLARVDERTAAMQKQQDKTDNKLDMLLERKGR